MQKLLFIANISTFDQTPQMLKRHIIEHFYCNKMAAVITEAIIFDWDNTLCPTTLIEEHQAWVDIAGPPTSEFAECCEMLENSINALLTEAKKYASVCIVTASLDGWISQICARWFPGVRLDGI